MISEDWKDGKNTYNEQGGQGKENDKNFSLNFVQ